MVTVYGISNCDTVRKARRWLDAHGVEYRFHDFRKDGVDAGTLAHWADQAGWETLVNRRGTTWRKLDDAEKTIRTAPEAVRLMEKHPAVITRPVITDGKRMHVGFTEADYRAFLAHKPI